ncbi:ornithine cyclodeaminase family protein [Nonomuraea sp. NPDC046802]|uniref:ornithine cyclodeaminase family protein n=1 Tax=Nonomuraea sp. NPDC046802 TaxID=3154919 RepID=UPI0033E38A77
MYGPDLIRRSVGFADLIEPVKQSFADFSGGRGESPIVVFAPAGPDGDVHVKSSWADGRDVFIVKVATWFAARALGGRPPASGFMAVHDATTGDLLALLQDEHHLTDVRTAAASAVATRLLARQDAAVLAVLGTGVQAYLQVLATLAVRPIDTVIIWGRREQAAHTLRTALNAADPSLSISVARQAEYAVRSADVIVTATGSRRPILYGDWLRPGQHVTATGADDRTKTELDTACFRRADLLAVDSREHAPAFAGDLHAATTPVHAEIGELVLGRAPGRHDPDQITIAKLVGLGIQDLAAAQTTLRLLESPPADRPRPASGQDLVGSSDRTIP